MIGSTLALALTATGPVAQHFTLLCEGTKTSGPSQATNEARWQSTIHVDLAKMRYCSGSCEKWFQIRRVTPLEIVFRDEAQEAGENMHSRSTWSRRTGEYLSTIGTVYAAKGMCRSSIDIR
ncbi:MAG: hypothetical protein ACXU8Z_16790 [Caulobacteraceae bacterium]